MKLAIAALALSALVLAILLFQPFWFEQETKSTQRQESPAVTSNTATDTEHVIQASATSPVPAATSVSTHLQPPDASQPAAGICAGPLETDVVTITVNVDTPSPRCIKVTPSQHFRIVNATKADVQVRLAQFGATIKPGDAQIFDAPFGSYLEPGVHDLFISPPGGVSIWLVNPN